MILGNSSNPQKVFKKLLTVPASGLAESEQNPKMKEKRIDAFHFSKSHKNLI